MKYLNPPMLPKFVCPKGLSQEQYLTQMARKGYTKTSQRQGWR